ncbi:transposase, partial [Candidatus Bathyarchaeota archaeon]|nr:transposase [Candidatus Bathyarchaeota archaeon]
MLNETCRFKLKPSEEHRAILEDLFKAYSEIVETCLDRAICLNVTSRRKLHEAIYRDLRLKYAEYPSHYIYTAITHALTMFKSYRRLSRKRRNVSLPNVKNLNAILLDDTHLFWFNWGSLKLSTHRGHITILLEIHEHAKKFMDWQVKGSRLVRKGNCFFLHVNFKKTVEERKPEGVLGIDVNERSIDLAVVKPDKVGFVKIDISDAKHIRERYFRKRRKIQKLSGKVRDELLAKYSGRERHRVDDIIHKASNVIKRIVARENVKPVMEDLTYLRDRIRYGRRMNRRLHSMPFRKIQFYISYKAMEYGFKPEFADAKNTSRTCPMCGEVSKPNGQVFECKCGFKADRHFVAAWNIALKLPMCRPLPLAAKA